MLFQIPGFSVSKLSRFETFKLPEVLVNIKLLNSATQRNYKKAFNPRTHCNLGKCFVFLTMQRRSRWWRSSLALAGGQTTGATLKQTISATPERRTAAMISPAWPRRHRGERPGPARIPTLKYCEKELLLRKYEIFKKKFNGVHI